MSEKDLSLKKKNIDKNRVIIICLILFAISSVLIVKYGDNSKDKNDSDISVFSEKDAKKTKSSKSKITLDEVNYAVPEENDQSREFEVGVEINNNKADSIIEKSMGMTREEFALNALVLSEASKAHAPHKVHEMFSEIEDEKKIIRINDKKESDPKKDDESKCDVVDRNYSKAIIVDSNEIRGLEKKASWSIKNDSDKPIALIVSQDKKEVGVAFVQQKSTYKTSIAATPLSILIKSGEGSCVDLTKKSGVKTALPIKREKIDGKQVEMASFYELAKFETVVAEVNNRIIAKTNKISD